MKKLEFRHVAPYLPYRLQLMQDCSKWFKPEKDKIVELSGIKIVDKGRVDWFSIHYNEGENSSGCFESYDFKPILHPLSDLTKPIEHNGKKFVPVEKIGNKEYKYQYFDKNIGYAYSKINGKLADYLRFLNVDVLQWNYVYFSKLTEWHFDCFSLIENNLAIDINTLKK